jgi:transposase InsO family protein
MEHAEPTDWTRGAVVKQLNNLYYAAGDPGSYGGVERLYKRAKAIGIPVTRDQVTEYMSAQLPYSIHKPARHTFPRNHTFVGYIDQQWQADLADMQSLASDNDQYNYILTCIDVLSRYAWAVPVRSKSSKHMLIAFKKLFQLAHPRVPQRFQTDDGKEFFNREVSAMLRDKDITHFSTHSDKKAAVVERFNRTLKSRLYVYFTAHKTKRYVDVLQDIVYAYNHCVHRGIRMRPVDVDGEPAAAKAWMNLFYKDTCKQGAAYQKIADNQRVRITRWKGEFEKGYVPNWTREHFRIQKHSAHPHAVYKLRDAAGESVEGNFYSKELQPIPREVLQVERVLKRRKRGKAQESLVKWIGWPDKYNRWISKEDLKKYQRTPADRACNVDSS